MNKTIIIWSGLAFIAVCLGLYATNIEMPTREEQIDELKVECYRVQFTNGRDINNCKYIK